MSGALDRLTNTAQRLTKRFGKDVTFVAASQGFSPSDGEVTESSETTTDVTVTPPRGVDLTRVDGNLIEEGDAIVDVPAKSYVPARTEKVDMDGRRWSIKAISRIYSGNDVALYRVLLGR